MRREWRERFPRLWLQKIPLVSDPSMHHGTCVTHVQWCMSASLTRGDGKNVLGIPGACATHNFTYLARGPLSSIMSNLVSLVVWKLLSFIMLYHVLVTFLWILLPSIMYNFAFVVVWALSSTMSQLAFVNVWILLSPTYLVAANDENANICTHKRTHLSPPPIIATTAFSRSLQQT